MKFQLKLLKKLLNEEVDAKLENERKNLAELVVKEGAAAEGDTVVIDFVGSIDGVEFDGGKVTTSHLDLVQVNSSRFEDQLVGAKAGDEVEVK